MLTVAPSLRCWTDIVAANPNATVYQTPSWMAIQRGCFGYTDRTAILPEAADPPVLFACMEVGGRGRLFRDFRSVPGGYGGFLASANVTPATMRRVWGRISRVCQIGSRLTIRGNPLTARQYAPPAAMPLVHTRCLADFTHILDLEPGFDELWSKAFDKKARNQYRKGIKEGVTVRRDTSPEAIGNYHRLHVKTSQGWAAHERRSLPFFEKMLRFGAGAVTLWLADAHDGTPIGGLIALEFGQTVHIWGTARDADFASVRPMDVLYAEVIKDACGRGFRRVDLGSSLGLASVQAFKEQFGAQRVGYAVWVLEGPPWWVGRALRRT